MHDLLLHYLIGDLDAADKRMIEEKLASDPAWQAEWRRLQAVDAELKSYAAELKTAPDGYWNNFQVRLDARREARPPKTALRFTLTYAMPVMAAAALVMIFLNVFRSDSMNPSATAFSSYDLDTAMQALKPDWVEDYWNPGETSASAEYQMSEDDLKAIRERLHMDFRSVGTDGNTYLQTLSHDDQKELLQQLENTTIM